MCITNTTDNQFYNYDPEVEHEVEHAVAERKYQAVKIYLDLNSIR